MQVRGGDSVFDPGRLYHRRREIHGPYKGQPQGGISTPAEHPLVFIFTGEEGKQHGYRDRWLDVDTFEYWGEGQLGPMTFERSTNRAIRDHVESGKDLLLFASDPSGLYRFIDQMVCTGYRMDKGPDREGAERDEIVFQLVRLSATSPQTGPERSPEGSPHLTGLDLDALRDRALTTAANERPVKERVAKFQERSAAITIYARRRANGRCEGCREPAPFRTKQGVPYLEVHHVRRLTDGGPDHPSWVVAICPTCHRRAHYAGDAAEYNMVLTENAHQAEAKRT